MGFAPVGEVEVVADDAVFVHFFPARKHGFFGIDVGDALFVLTDDDFGKDVEIHLHVGELLQKVVGNVVFFEPLVDFGVVAMWCGDAATLGIVVVFDRGDALPVGDFDVELDVGRNDFGGVYFIGDQLREFVVFAPWNDFVSLFADGNLYGRGFDG